MTSFRILAGTVVVGVAVFGMMTSANAASLRIVDAGSGLQFGTIPDLPPGNTTTPENNVLENVFGVNSMDGYYGGAIELIGKGTVTYEVFGWEAGWENEVFIDGAKRFDALNGDATYAPDLNSPLYSWTSAMMDGGLGTLLDFTFKADTDGSRGEITNGDNNGETDKPNFFASIMGKPNAKSGRAVYLFLDDGGAGPNNDHDDYVMRATVAPVPVPAAGIMLLAGLGGLAALRRRKA